MNRLRLKFTVAAAAVVIFTLLLIGLAAAAGKGEKAPGFKLPSLRGGVTTLDQIRMDPAHKGKNRVVLLSFWATWCPYCVQETPYLQELHTKYQKKGLAVVGISVDSGGAADVRPFVKEHKLTYTMLLDKAMTAAHAYGVRPIPVTFLIDKSGIIRQTHLGFDPSMMKDLESEIQPLLK